VQHGKLAFHGIRCPAAKSCCDNSNAARFLREAAGGGAGGTQARRHRLSADAKTLAKFSTNRHQIPQSFQNAQLLEAALVLLDKLAAMDLVLAAKPIIAGRYSAVPWDHYMLPLAHVFRCCPLNLLCSWLRVSPRNTRLHDIEKNRRADC